MKDLVTNLEQLVTFIYAFPQKNMQCDLWEEVLKLDPINSPWCLVGDFNNIIDLSEKVEGNQTHTTDMNNFINFLNCGNLLSLNASEFLLLGLIVIQIIRLFSRDWIGWWPTHYG